MRIYLCALIACLIATPILAKPSKNGSNGDPVSLLLSFGANQTTIAPGEQVRLNWVSSGASSCFASGAWDGRKGLSGDERTLTLQNDSTFTLTCKSKKRRVIESVFVHVVHPSPTPEPVPLPEPEPEPETEHPSLHLSSSRSHVTSGESITLNWQSEHADNCEASGDWQGIKPVSGSEVITNVIQTQSFSMTCTGGGGSALAITSVSTIGELTLSWQPPINNNDGSPIVGIANYKLYRGIESGRYGESFVIAGELNAFKVSAEIGTRYYFTLTAIDINGAESSYSDEVSGQAH